MIRVFTAVAIAAAVVGTPVAESAATPNDHDCAGVVVSTLAGPGFGALVSAAAHGQAVDNLGLADCGQTNRNNP